MTGESPLGVPDGRGTVARVDVVGARGPSAAGPARLQPQYVGVLTRAMAFGCDAVVINVVALLVAAGTSLILSILHLPTDVKDVIFAIGGVIYVLWNIGYFAVFWASTGQTLGNRVMQIRVVPARGEKLPLRRAVVRYGAMLLAAIPMFAGFIPALYDSRRRAFQDYVARTVVVESPVLSAAEQWRLHHGAGRGIIDVGASEVQPNASPPTGFP